MRQRGSRPRGGRILTVAQTRVTSQSSRSAEPVDNVESVEEALRRLWVKEGGEVAVGVNLLQALLDLRVGWEEEKDLPERERRSTPASRFVAALVAQATSSEESSEAEVTLPEHPP